MNHEMKETIQTTTYLAVVLLFIISLFIFPRFLTKEGEIVEYRLESTTNEHLGDYPIIRTVIEDGSDKFIYLPKYTFDQAFRLTDSLNKQLIRESKSFN